MALTLGALSSEIFWEKEEESVFPLVSAFPISRRQFSRPTLGDGAALRLDNHRIVNEGQEKQHAQQNDERGQDEQHAKGHNR